MYKKFALIAQIVGYVTIALLAVFGLFTLLRVQAAQALGLQQAEPQAPQAPPVNVPQTMNYAGTLRDSAGELLTGAYTMTLRIYADVADPVGAELWSELHGGVVVRDGAFDVVLGDITPLPPTLFSASDTRYLGVTVDPYTEMIPRQRLSSVPYAVQAVKASDELPAGVIMAWAGTTPPDGWLICNGAEVSRADYAELFAAIGASQGPGDGSTTFDLPDYRGLFLRGVDGGRGEDPDRLTRLAPDEHGGNTGDNVGSVQNDIYQSHNHTYTRYGGTYQVWGAVSGDWYWHSTSTQNTSDTGGSETRPVNAYVYWIIKY